MDLHVLILDHFGYRSSPTGPSIYYTGRMVRCIVVLVCRWSFCRTISLAKAHGTFCIATLAPVATNHRQAASWALSHSDDVTAWRAALSSRESELRCCAVRVQARKSRSTCASDAFQHAVSTCAVAGAQVVLGDTE